MINKRLPMLFVAAVALLFAGCTGQQSVTSVRIDVDELRLAPGAQKTLTAEVEVVGTATEEVVWSSSDNDVVTIDEDGIVTAVAVGTASVRAESTADRTKFDDVDVTVLSAPSSADSAAAGEATAEVDGEPATPVITDDGDVVSVSLDGTQLGVGFQDSEGSALPYTNGGVPRVPSDGTISLAGSGYAPATHVDVWFLSEPVLLGSVITDGDGAFEADFTVPADVGEGEHNLVTDGTNAGGSTLSLRLGLEVVAPADVPAALEFAHCPAVTGWFVSDANGAVGATGDAPDAPLATIQAAVDTAASGDTVCVSAGTYAVDNSGVGSGGASVTLVRIDKPLTILGPNVGVAGADVREDEAWLVVSSSEADSLYAFRVLTSDVTVDGFGITTTTPKVDPFPDGVSGIRVLAEATQGVTIRNNRLVDTNFPIWVNRGRAEESATGFRIERNLVEGPLATSDQAIYVQGAEADVTDNVLRDTRVGIQVQPYHNVGSGLTARNDIQAFQAGLWFNYQEHDEAHWTFEDNDVIGTASPLGWPLYTEDPNMWSGIRIETFNAGTVTFEGNTVEVGEANPPGDARYLVRQRSVSGGIVNGMGTLEAPGEFFTSNSFPDFPGGVDTDDLSEEDGLLQLVLPGL